MASKQKAYSPRRKNKFIKEVGGERRQALSNLERKEIKKKIV